MSVLAQIALQHPLELTVWYLVLGYGTKMTASHPDVAACQTRVEYMRPVDNRGVPSNDTILPVIKGRHRSDFFCRIAMRCCSD
jgi:hypothetical protein